MTQTTTVIPKVMPMMKTVVEREGPGLSVSWVIAQLKNYETIILKE